MFDLRRLRLLHELALRGTLAAVAEALASPSTVSQQLLSSSGRPGPAARAGRPTGAADPHGQALAAHAARMLELDEAARADLASIRSGLAPCASP